ncbi:MAG: hypothetical protein J2P24_06990 [Streptosporangiales bacterium]|nr:hypothetical protein [Streptosporangiales bacterium]MBO0889284.1 hypothetical protein [Acidothermales bacterium]
MVDYAEAYEQEQRRIAPFQQRPEWRDWLAGMDAALAGFFDRVVPDMPADPWSEEGLRHAEAAALERFPDADSADPETAQAGADVIDGFRRYLGELLVRRFEGAWVYVDLGATGLVPAVALPYSPEYFDVGGALTMAVQRRTGGEWSAVHRFQREDHDAWVGAGRPEPPVWQQMQDDEALA